MPHYNDDMMHCQQDFCAKKEQCYRYWLGQHAKGIVTMYMPKEPIRNGCEHYLNKNEY